MTMPLDIGFENKLIKDYAKEMYEEILSHASRRQLEPDFVVNKFLSELQSLARKDEYIKQLKGWFNRRYARYDIKRIIITFYK